MKIVDMQGPLVDSTSFEPYLRITLEMPLELQQEERPEQENALIIYRAWVKALEEWNNQTLTEQDPNHV